MRLLVGGIVVGAAVQTAIFATGFAYPAVLAGAVLITLTAILATVVNAFRAARSAGAERRAWACVAIGMAAWIVGCVLHLYDAAFDIERVAPRPADLFSGIATVMPALALIVGPAAPSSWHNRLRLTIDGAMVSTALLIPAWLTLLGPAYSQTGAAGGIVAVAFPAVQIIALSVALVLLSRSTTEGVNAYTMLAVAFGLYAVCALTYTGVTTFAGTWKLTAVSGLFIAGTMVLVAGTRYDMPPSDRPWLGIPRGVRGALPYVPVVAAFVVAAIERLRGASDGVQTAALFVLFALVLVRQFLALRFNSTLLAEVEKQRVQLQYQATHDHLTGLSNRSDLHQQADKHLQTGGPVGLLLVDLDGFKQVNDRFGHAAGDAVLTHVAKVLNDCVPPGHTVARLGGDEFAVLMHPAPPIGRTMEIAEELVAGIAAGKQVGASIGVAYESDGQATIGMLLSDADAALYRAKAEGKGKVIRSTRISQRRIRSAGDAIRRIEEQLAEG